MIQMTPVKALIRRTLMRPGVILALALAAPSSASAGEAENILACIDAVESYSSRTVDEFDVRYTGRILGFSSAEWQGIVCEITLGQVYNLTVDGHQYIYEGFSGRQASIAYEGLEMDTEEAISLLESRIPLLERRLEDARDRLQMPSADIEEIQGFIAEGIARATGN